MTTLKVLDLNVWGIHYLAKRIRERLGFIAEEIKQYDIVGLQEVWSREDYAFLVEKLHLCFPFSHHTHRGIIGSGLCVFSRYPIAFVCAHRFTVNGSVTEIKDGEIFAGKSIMLCRIHTSAGDIAFYNTHTNPTNRDTQMFEIYQFVEATRGSMPVILVGDFNTKPKHLAYSVLTKCLRLQDVFQDNPVDTCDRKSNVFTESRMTPKRIDFVLFSPCEALELKDHRLALSGLVPGKSFPFSDHEGVEAVFLLKDKPVIPLNPKLPDEAIQVFIEISERLEAKKKKLLTNTFRVLSSFAVTFILCLLVIFTACNHTLFVTLASVNLHWLTTSCVGVVCSAGVVYVVNQFYTVRVLNYLESDLCELKTLLDNQKYLRSL